MIKTKQELLNHFSDINTMYNNPFMYQTLSNMIDELLEQQPCEDAISRQAVIKYLDNITMDTNPDHYVDKNKWYQANGFNLCKVGVEMYIENLPSVTPKAELCEDCIRRSDVLALAEKGELVSNGNYQAVCKVINELPSVMPKGESESDD